MKDFTCILLLFTVCSSLSTVLSQHDYDYQYYEADRTYRGRRQDVLQGQFVDPRQQQLEEEAEVVGDPPVPVVIKGIQMVPSDDPDYDYDDGNKPAFSFDNDTKMNLDGPGYALSLLLIGEIVILAMAFFVGGLGFGGRSFSSPTRVPGDSFLGPDLGHGVGAAQSPWSAALNSLDGLDLGHWLGNLRTEWA